jgi:hypothetical protein
MTVVGNLEAQTDSGGEFILTDIPAKYNGKYAWFYAMGTDNPIFIFTTDDINTAREGKSYPIINGKVIFPLWFVPNGSNVLERYSGNDTFSIYISIFEKEERNSKLLEKIEFTGGKNVLDSKSNRVPFSNGSLTRSYKDKSLVINTR